MRVIMMVLAVVFLGSTASAVLNPFKKRTKTVPTTQAKQKVDFSVEPSAAPSDELTVNEFQLQRKDLVGQVVELEFDRVIDLKQSNEGYSARVTFESGRVSEGVVLLISEAGMDLFEKMADRDGRSPLRQTVYVEVISGSISRAVGERYSKNKPEGERYSW